MSDSSELAKPPSGPDGSDGDIRKLMMEIRYMREQMADFEKEYRSNIGRQTGILEGLLKWCDYLLYRSIKRCERHEKGTPEGR